MPSHSPGVVFGVMRVRIERIDGDRYELYRRALGVPKPNPGPLELGIVRDSTLNLRNDYAVFGETFENVASLGRVTASDASG